MKIITLHCDYIRFKALKKAVKDAEELKNKNEVEVKEPLVVLTAVEQGDNKETISQLVKAVQKTAKEVKAKNIVLYPYAHLSSNLAPPSLALSILKESASLLSKKFKVTRAPFGYYKQFELRVKGHPLSELSKVLAPTSSKKSPPGELVELDEEHDIKKLLREISKTKLDTSKLKDNDHRILGQKLDLFSFNESAPGMVFWHDDGYFIYNQLLSFLRKLIRKHDYKEISTPQILNSNVFRVSGHWKNFKDNMFLAEIDKKIHGIKPMNCPGTMLLYKANPKSYKDLPLRLAEFGVLHRNELSGVLSGLLRVTRMIQDDAHIFCTKDQIESEIIDLLDIVKTVYKIFDFEYSFEFSTRPERYMGDIKDWDHVEKILEKILKKSKVKFKINKGEGTFYGPKIDIHIKDSLGREWQCATIQLDMQMPRRFELTYVGEDNKEHTPFVIHRTIIGTLERFIGVLLEHTNGNLPLWLSPRQVRVINFTDRNTKAAEKFVSYLKEQIPDIRIETDFESDTVQSKIRNAELLKTNYTIVIGDKEEKSKTLAVRPRGGKPKFGVKKEKFIEDLKKELGEVYKNL